MKPDFARFEAVNMVQYEDSVRIFFRYDDWNAVIQIGGGNVGRWWSEDENGSELTLEEVKLLLMKYLNVGW